jgi:hypothetical protein
MCLQTPLNNTCAAAAAVVMHMLVPRQAWRVDCMPSQYFALLLLLLLSSRACCCLEC